MTRWLAAAACLLVAACGDADPNELQQQPLVTQCEPAPGPKQHILVAEQWCTSWRVDGDFESWQVAAFHSASARWNAFLGRERFTVLPDGVCPITKRDLSVEAADSFFRYDDRSLAIDITRFGNDFPAQDREHFEMLVMHEMGHAAGMRHVPTGLMGAGKEHATVDFTNDDRAECTCIGLCR